MLRDRHLLLLSLLLGACGQTSGLPAPSPAPSPAITAAPKAHIDWFDGPVEDALITARDTGRPIFLYWGAQWCPPCNQIKSTIFVRPDFIARTRSFIAVYLDGDSPGAQRWGEHFGTSGYPTLIVLRPDGTELTRLSSGMDAARYPEVLDLALARNRPARERLHQALRAPEELTPQDWTLLALYSWDADNGRSVAADALAGTLHTLGQHCHDAAASACERLRLLAAIESLDGKSPAAPADAALLRAVLSSPRRTRLNLTELQYHGVALLAASTPAGSPEREQLSRTLRQAMRQVFADEDLPIKQRLLSTRLLIDLAVLEGRGRDAALQSLVRERATWADAQASRPYERQSLIYNAAWYLHEVGLSDEALAMFERELDRAVSPHYYMSYLARIEEDRGRSEKALAWARRAWEAAQGPATRTQWGTAYARALMRLAPDDAAGIEQTIGALLDDMQRSHDGFHTRSLLRMRWLDQSLQDWAATAESPAQDIAVRLRQRLLRMCRRDHEDAADCQTFT